MAFTITVNNDDNHSLTFSKNTLARRNEANVSVTVVVPAAVFALGSFAYVDFVLPDGTAYYKGDYDPSSGSFTFTLGSSDVILQQDGRIGIQFVLRDSDVNPTVVWKSELKYALIGGSADATAQALTGIPAPATFPVTFPAANVSIVDAGTYFASPDVEDALQEVGILNNSLSSRTSIAENNITTLQFQIGVANSDIDTLQTDLDLAEAAITSLSSGSPAGTYASLAALAAAIPAGNTNIYVTLDDGHWAYWNGAAWADGGVYTATNATNMTVADAGGYLITTPKTVETMSQDFGFKISQISVNGYVTPINTSFFVRGKNLFNLATITSGYFVNNATGAIQANASYDASDYIPIAASTNYVQSSALHTAFYNSAKAFISGLAAGTSPRSFTTPALSAYMRQSMAAGSGKQVLQVELGSISTAYESYLDTIPNNKVAVLAGVNLPPNIPAIVGKELNIYFQNILEDSLANVQMDNVGSGGKQQVERYTVTPLGAGSTAIYCDVYKGVNRINSPYTTIVTKAASVGTGVNRSLIVIGDSTISAGAITAELLTLFTADPMDITLLGSKGTAPNLHEGRSGWTAALYNSNDADNAFWNPGTSAFDFSYYMTEQGYASVDRVIIDLGINDVFSYTSDATCRAEITNVIARYQTMIDSIRAYSATTKIGIALTIPPSISQDAFGTAYANNQSQFRYKRNNFLLVQALIGAFKSKEASNIYLVPIHVNLDTVNNFPTETVAVNSRNSATVVRQTNGVHPAASGYYQIADMIYYWLKSFEL